MHRKISYLLLALVLSTLGWITLAYANVCLSLDKSGAQVLGLFLLTLGLAYLLVSLLSALYALNRFTLSENKLMTILSIVGFSAALPLAVLFNLADKPAYIVSMACLLAGLPLAFLYYKKLNSPISAANDEEHNHS